jgi:hypothetical protein
MRPALLPAAALLGAAAASGSPGPQPFELPPGWEARLIRYASVDVPDRKVVRHIHATAEALSEARPGQPAPYGTLLVMAEARARLDAVGNPILDAAGRFVAEPGWTAILAQRKAPGAGGRQPPALRNGDWEYAAFDGAGRPRDTTTGACLACHGAARAAQDFTFTFWDHLQARR